MTNPHIIAIATATPPNRVDQDQALQLAASLCTNERQLRLASALYRHSGVSCRYSVVPYTEAHRWLPEASDVGPTEPIVGPGTAERMELYQQHALPLATRAAQAAVEQSKLPPEAITHVVTASCTGFVAPGIDSGLIQGLQLRPTTERVHVGYMGCHGAINALRVARGLTFSDAHVRVLVCAIELCSLHYCFHWDSERMLGNALFADGAGAVVLGQRSDTSSNSLAHRWQLVAMGSCLFPGTADCMTWNVGNHGFAMTISSRLPELIESHLAPWLTSWLAEQGLHVENVGSWAVHPGGPKILEAVETALGLSREQTRVSREVLSQFGNMSSATVLFVLERLLLDRSPAPCVALGFGPGLAAEAALWR